jgi:hypothetical protein
VKSDWTVRVNRLRRVEWFGPKNLSDPWDGKEIPYFTLVFDDTYYGETLQHVDPDNGKEVGIKMAPIQGMPLITNVSASDFSLSEYNVRPFRGEFDMEDRHPDRLGLPFVNPDLMVHPFLSALVKGSFVFYEAEHDPGYVNAVLMISAPGVGQRPNLPSPTVGSPGFTITSVNVSNPNLTPPTSTSIILTATNHNFYSLNTIGHFRFGTQGVTSTLKIFTYGVNYDHPDIDVTYTP